MTELEHFFKPELELHVDPNKALRRAPIIKKQTFPTLLKAKRPQPYLTKQHKEVKWSPAYEIWQDHQNLIPATTSD